MKKYLLVFVVAIALVGCEQLGTDDQLAETVITEGIKDALEEGLKVYDVISLHVRTASNSTLLSAKKADYSSFEITLNNSGLSFKSANERTEGTADIVYFYTFSHMLEVRFAESGYTTNEASLLITLDAGK